MSEPCAGAPLLTADTIGYRYGSYQALDGVSFQLAAGELAVLLGTNGAGKSTLLRCLAGWALPTGGDVSFLDASLRRHERAARRNGVFVPDAPAFYDELTAREHLQFVAQARRQTGWQPEAEALLRRFGLWAQRATFPLSFSRGMRYKLALCMALLVRPRLLLLDEPFGPLDPLSAGRLWEDLLAGRAAGMGILLSSHQLPAGATPDCFLILEQGTLLAVGTPDELAQNFGLEQASLDDLLRAVVAGQEDEDEA